MFVHPSLRVTIESGVHHGCVLAPDSFATGVDYWQKTKVQALGSREDKPSTITAQGLEVAVVEDFVHLGSTTQSSSDISRRNAITREAMQNLDDQIWKSRISISTERSCIILAFYPSSECWAVTKRDAHKIDALLLINDVCVSCWESNGTTLCRMMMWDGKQGNHIF